MKGWHYENSGDISSDHFVADFCQTSWLKRVYKIDYEKNLETDVQDVFIKSLKVEGDTLIVTDERGLVHKMSLKN